jgi:hypothetical protein
VEKKIQREITDLNQTPLVLEKKHYIKRCEIDGVEGGSLKCNVSNI